MFANPIWCFKKSVLTITSRQSFQNRIFRCWCKNNITTKCSVSFPTGVSHISFPTYRFPQELFASWSLLFFPPGLNPHCLLLSCFFPSAGCGMASSSLLLKFMHILSKDAVCLGFQRAERRTIMSFSSCIASFFLDRVLPAHPCYMLLCLSD